MLNEITGGKYKHGVEEIEKSKMLKAERSKTIRSRQILESIGGAKWLSKMSMSCVNSGDRKTGREIILVRARSCLIRVAARMDFRTV